MAEHLKLTREELYSLVWAKPMTEVAQDFQISDRAMAKICARKQVPVPPRGYWAKRNAGKSVSKSPLPEFVVRPPQEERGVVAPARQTTEKRKFRTVFEERNQTIRRALKEFRKPLSEAIDYSVRIQDWRCDYSFGLNPSYDPLHRDNGLWSYGLMGAFGLVLASVGLAGVTAYSVSSRVHEIGIRLALWARSKDILRMIMAEGATLIAFGSFIGITLAVLAMHVMTASMDPVSQSIQHSQSDLRIAASALGILFIVGLLACYLPARRRWLR